jgi:hypothetical protein
MAEGRRQFRIESFRLMIEAAQDAGLKYLRRHRDLQMLLTFLERFDRLGWLPPADPEKRRLLEAHGVTMHVVSGDLCFYEFVSKGARGERDPWLTIFFHMGVDGQLRICGVERTDDVERRRRGIVENIEARVERLDERLRKRKEL